MLNGAHAGALASPAFATKVHEDLAAAVTCEMAFDVRECGGSLSVTVKGVVAGKECAEQHAGRGVKGNRLLAV
jgi:hypothetical protein